MLDTFMAILLSYCYEPLGFDWRCRSDSGRSYERLKAICFLIARLQWLATVAMASIARLGRYSKKQESRVEFEYPAIRETSDWRTIRLFRLHKGSRDDPLSGDLTSCVFITVYLWTWSFDMPIYDAISYRWDQSSASPEIVILDKRPLSITAGLADMLQHLRLPHKDRYLWIDQVCINQQDIDEKNFQVRRMGEIYANANQVIAWLGKVSASAEVLLTALDGIDDAMAQNRSMYFEAEIQPGQPVHGNVTAAHSAAVLALESIGVAEQSDINHSRSHQQWQAEVVWKLYEELLDNAWFERMWILQEVVLAHDVVMQSGHHIIPWRRFHGALRIASANVSGYHTMALNVQAVAVIDVLRHTHCTLDGFSIPLARLLKFTQPRDAFDPRDKVYGLMGMVTPWSTIRMPAEEFSAIDTGFERSALSEFYLQKRASGPVTPTVDYNHSVEQVYIDTTRVCLANGSLEILKDCCAYQEYPTAGTEIYSPTHGHYTCRNPESSLKLPSWVTDWSLTTEGNCKSPLVDDLRTKEQSYRACGDHTASIQTIRTTSVSGSSIEEKSNAGGSNVPSATSISHILFLQGWLFDQVIDIVSVLHTEASLGRPECRHIWREWARVAFNNSDSGPYGNERHARKAALERTLLSDKASLLDDGRIKHDALDDSGIWEMIIGGAIPPGHEVRYAPDGRWYYVDHNTQSTSWTHPREHELDQDFKQASKRMQSWFEKYGHRYLNQRLFRTRRGYIGMSCKHVQNGDQVAIFWGGRLPYLLRACTTLHLSRDQLDQINLSEGAHQTYQLIGGECYIHGLVDGEALSIIQMEGMAASAILVQ